ncbi:endolytic transglycosylase MltG [uncultured Kordia sp.]|uniref:endolytic transglycosylase MltG n=1 Tax=uncultured Kordia sp. TaxID=507699 RepID=UPI00260F4395|nr:endolytic transglycosylase MltG [uncultured Kordia sp.]
MYIRKILIGILILGILGGCYIMYNISQTIFKPITAFNNEVAYIYIPSDADFKYVKGELEPLLNDMEAFETLAKKLGYKKRVKGGKYIIRKGMNSNDLVKTLLNKGILVDVIIPNTNKSQEIAAEVSTYIEATEKQLTSVMENTMFLKKLIQEKKLKDSAIYKPGTYKMPWSTTAEAFRDYMVKNSQKQTQQ